MPKLLHICLARDEECCIENMLKSILPHVEASYVLVDDRSQDRTEEILRDYGCVVDRFTFENFAKHGNKLLKWVTAEGDWVFRLAPDEMITKSFGEKMITVMEASHDTDIEGVYYSRKNWLNSEMTEEYSVVYPDKQLRLYRLDFPRIHYIKYVHEVVTGFKKIEYINEDIHHLCWYWNDKLEKKWDKLELYKQLRLQEQQDKSKGINNIWPDQKEI